MMIGVATAAIAGAASSSSVSTYSTLAGVTASLVAVLMWIITFHKRFFVSLLKTDKVTAYGVYATFNEALSTHFTYLLRGLIPQSLGLGLSGPRLEDRDGLEHLVEKAFRREFFLYEHDNDDDDDDADKDDNYTTATTNEGQGEGNVLIAHSCRSIFYYVIRSLLNNAKQKQQQQQGNDDGGFTSQPVKIRICLGSLHFGSFYRLLKGIEKSMSDGGCTIDFYEIDFNSHKDWTLQQDTIDIEQLQSCDLLLVQHVFGQPLNHDRLVRLAKQHNIPILEDCVQSGSLFSKYRGYKESDVVMYSGGLDKTPPCFGGGFAMFRNTQWGDDLYKYCSAIHNILPVDSWSARFWTCFTITLHLMIAKNQFGFNNLLGLVSYVWVTERGEYINWYAISLKVRKAKIITPFQHAESGFLRKPSIYQLQSMLYGLSKRDDLQRMAQHELQGRELLLSCIPSQYHHALFPFLTKEALRKYRDNVGVSEFAWVVSPIGDRTHLCQYLNDHFIVSLVNTTWEASDKTKSVVARRINNNLVYLPNINEMSMTQIQNLGRVLTSYCQELESNGEYDF